MDRRRRQWLAVDVHYYDSTLAESLREEFGINAVVIFDAYLRACKRNSVQGQLTYGSDADFLAQIGLPGLALVDETGTGWTLDALWTFLGRMKNIRRTVRGRLTNVRATRWEQWETRRSRARNAGPLPTEYGARQDIDSEREIDTDIEVRPAVAVPDEVWSIYAQKALSMRPTGSVKRTVSWLDATERKAREEHGDRAADLMACYELRPTELVDVLMSDTAPPWLRGLRRSS